MDMFPTFWTTRPITFEKYPIFYLTRGLDDLDVGKLKTVLADMKKLSNAVDNEVVKNTNFNTRKTKINNLNKKIPDAITLIHTSQYNTDKKKLEKKLVDLQIDKKMPRTSGLVTTSVLNTKIGLVENKIPDTTNLVTASVLNTKFSKVENKISDYARYITTQEFNKLTAENFAARLTQASLVSKNDFDNKLISLNRKFTLNKTKCLEVQNKLSSLTTQDYNFSQVNFIFQYVGSKNTFVYQPTLDTLELKKDKGTDSVICWKSKGVYNSKLKPLYTTFLHSINFSGYKMGIKFDKDPLAV